MKKIRVKNSDLYWIEPPPMDTTIGVVDEEIERGDVGRFNSMNDLIDDLDKDGKE